MSERRKTVSVVSGLMVLLLGGGCANDAAEPSGDGASTSDAEGSAPAARSGPGRSGRPVDAVEEYEACPAAAEPTIECEWLRSLVVAQVLGALKEVGDSKDQRVVPPAMAALDLVDEPEIVVAATRILGHFPDTPGMVEKVRPLLLESPYAQVQQSAAALLGAAADQSMAATASQWQTNHSSLTIASPYEGLELPAHYDDMGFPRYPGMEPFTAADSDRSVGWWTADAAATVSAKLAQELGVEAMTMQQWSDRMMQESMAIAQSIDQSKVDEVQKLTEQYLKNQDPKLFERIAKLQEEIYAPMQAAADNSDKKVDQVMPPAQDYENTFFLIAEEKEGHVARLIIVYRQPGLERTVLQMTWDLRDYPPAWGDGAN
jgi:hypothetical protein